ncbi:unnamed protein product (mitochondrion) [Plasmodiophora brassicae]|uniref:Uncharacterized protein n=1 Tax=Plasmodiophora brassicae TaxID=37360 RepID=A0A3P3YAG8_PLABS|nr:unnamed protein product [Plasmodiophora brassicae]
MSTAEVDPLICLNDVFCQGTRLVTPIIAHVALAFIVVFLIYILRSDRFFASILALWEINLLIFWFVQVQWLWYALVAFDLWVMNKYLDTKKARRDDEEDVADENPDAEENMLGQRKYAPGDSANGNETGAESNDEGSQDGSIGSSEEKKTHSASVSQNPY